MGDISPIEQSPGANTETNEGKAFLERVERWVKERPIYIWGDRNARQVIANEIKRDVNGLGLCEPITLESVAQRAKSFNTEPIKVPLNDKITKEVFYQILRMENGYLIAEERKTEDLSSDANLISQAKLGPQGQTELTLSFTGDRFQTRDANPNIIHSVRFPNTTVKVLDTLIISVNGELKKRRISPTPTQVI